MVVRFQVDPDFYDHPKSIGMSDAAVALWTRAGSYSAAKHTDGFIAEHVLVTLSRTPEEAAAELVQRGLWRRVKGGWKFHQWDHRNLTKARIEEDRAADRDRKKRTRRAARGGESSAKSAAVDNSRAGTEQPVDNSSRELAPQVNGTNVRSDSGRTPDGIQPESGGNPAGSVSVSVSVSESVSGSGRGAAPPGAAGPNPGTDPPPPRCPEHLTDPKPPPCGPCAEARKARARWDAAAEAERVRRLADAPRCRKHRGQLAETCGPCRSERLAREEP